MQVSVALATFNGAQFLLKQLESILWQELAPLEVIISDDGSSDETLSIVNDFAKRARARFRVKVLSRPSTGDPSDNFRSILPLCGGDWIAFCDQDDIWHPQKLTKMMDVGMRTRAGLVSCEFTVITDCQSTPLISDSRSTSYKYFNRLQEPLMEYTLGCCQLVSARVARLQADGCPASIVNGRLAPHDFSSLMIARHLGGVAILRKALVFYRRHGANASAMTIGNKAHETHMRSITTADTLLAASCKAKASARWWAARGELGLAAQQAKDDWTRRAKSLEQRASVFSGRRLQRTRRLMINIATGVYGKSTAGYLPLRSLAADILRTLRTPV